MILEAIVKMVEERRDIAAREILAGLDQEHYWSKVGSYKAYCGVLDDIMDLASRLRKGDKA